MAPLLCKPAAADDAAVQAQRHACARVLALLQTAILAVSLLLTAPSGQAELLSDLGQLTTLEAPMAAAPAAAKPWLPALPPSRVALPERTLPVWCLAPAGPRPDPVDRRPRRFRNPILLC